MLIAPRPGAHGAGGSESGADQARLQLPDTLYTAIWWYARFPNHYSGDGFAARPSVASSRWMRGRTPSSKRFAP